MVTLLNLVVERFDAKHCYHNIMLLTMQQSASYNFAMQLNNSFIAVFSYRHAAASGFGIFKSVFLEIASNAQLHTKLNMIIWSVFQSQVTIIYCLKHVQPSQAKISDKVSYVAIQFSYSLYIDTQLYQQLYCL